MAIQKRRMLVVEEIDVTRVLTIINRHQGYFSDDTKIVKNYELKNDPSKWVIKFNASDREWKLMTKDLGEIGEIIVKVTPGGTTDMYFIRTGS